jgi:CxxC-x17-CxxC domain-containing protein
VFKVKCSDCKKVTSVSFEPTKGKPVYCRECLSKHRPNRSISPRQPRRFDSSNVWARRRDDSVKRKKKPKSVFKS